MPHQVSAPLCIAVSLFSSSMATLLHSWSAVCKLPCSACISLMFSMSAWTLLQHTYCLNKQKTKKVFLYLVNNLGPPVKFKAPSGRALLNYTQWFILVTFKNNIPKGKIYKLDNSHHTLSMHCKRYIRITSKNTQVLLSKIIGHI